MIRKLTKEDFKLYEQMETNLEDDYILNLFSELTEGKHTIYGLFVEGNLAAIAGYSLYAGEYAMLGRFRSDVRHQGKGYGTKILSYALKQALSYPEVRWTGGNTEKHNKAARAVLKKLGLPPVITLYAAQTEDVASLAGSGQTWNEITDINGKKNWLEQTYLNPDFEKRIFPYEAYYPFPVSPALFKNRIDRIRFFENGDKNRYVMLWEETKDKEYLHAVYPWTDFTEQAGFFETLDQELTAAKKRKPVISLWLDLSEAEAETLPAGHPFELPSPWMLHGMCKEDYLKKNSLVLP